MENDTKHIVDCLEDVLCQACSEQDGEYDTMALTAYAEAAFLLQALGRVEIIRGYGRRQFFKLIHAAEEAL